MNTRIIFIGAGRMAKAIVQGLLRNRYYAPSEIACTCGSGSSGSKLAEETGIDYCKDITVAAQSAETVVLACKPQQLSKLDIDVAITINNKLLISILAGTNIRTLKAKFPTARNIVRTMPNTPGQIGAGTTAYSPDLELVENDKKTVERILSSLGKFYAVNESALDAVTALSGSGPAYVFEFATALREAGVSCGLDAELSETLAIETLLGSAKLMEMSKESPENLRREVTSPGGTTAAALEALEKARFREIIKKALKAAKARSIELSQG